MIIVIIVCITLFAYVLNRQYRTYTKNFNDRIGMILNQVIQQYPEIEKSDIISLLNETESGNYEWFKEYGIDLTKDAAILVNEEKFKEFIVWDMMLFILLIFFLLFMFLKYNHRKDKTIKEIIDYMEQINRKNYKLDIEENTEDELSILKNELYKTTVMLKEVAENSVKDKRNLKNSLSDISHQLKTPITSILVILDNILENQEMNQEMRNEFIKDMKREMINIKFLVESLLKLSKIDSDAVIFLKKEVTMQEIVTEAIKNVEIISELHEIAIKVTGNGTDTILCDLKWQVEAVTNLLKNAIEHSKQNGKIEIQYEQNKIYSQIEITDYGVGIDKQDLPHIFERFYKGKNTSHESIGIGLALAKAIIERDNGYIQVESELGKGTTFVIKYLK